MHEAAIRSLAQVEAALEALRARAGTVLTAAAVIASFLGGQAISRNGMNAWVVLALGAFATVVLLTVHALVPKRLIFSVETEETYRSLLPRAHDDRLVDRALARLYHDLRSVNEPTIARLRRSARFGGVALIAETAFLGAGLA
jgi:hypothetical protein